MIKKLLFILESSEKKNFLILVIFSIFISLIEVIGISAIMPFISVTSDFSLIESNQYYSFLYNSFDFLSYEKFIIAFGLMLILFYLFRSIINLFYQFLLNKFTQRQYHIISKRLFKKYMLLDYQDFIFKNSSDLTKNIVNETANFVTVLSACLLIMSEVFVVILIYCVMLYVNVKVTLIVTFIILLNAFIMLSTVTKVIKKNGVIRANNLKSFYEILNRSFKNFKFIKLQSKLDITIDTFSTINRNYVQSNVVYYTLQQIPRLFLEALSFIIVIVIILFLIIDSTKNVTEYISTLSLFILSLYRLMPSANRIMNSINSIIFYLKSINIVYNDFLLKSEILCLEELKFNENIELKNLSFSYDNKQIILENINLVIRKGSKIGFIGESGSGKSTLVNLIIGLFFPSSGQIYVDKQLITYENLKALRKKIGYIPQDIYLFDGTVSENIVFGQKYDRKKVDDLLKKVKLYDFFFSRDGQETKVGESGVMLSGGQKQRIGIARALYLEPEILVLDEATSALDNDTEEEIINEVYNLTKEQTLIMIAHRLTTLSRCDKIFTLKNKQLL